MTISNKFQKRLTHFKRGPTSKDPISRPDFKRDSKQKRSDHWQQISREAREFQKRPTNFKKDPIPRDSVSKETQTMNTVTLWRQISRETHKFLKKKTNITNPNFRISSDSEDSNHRHTVVLNHTQKEPDPHTEGTRPRTR